MDSLLAEPLGKPKKKPQHTHPMFITALFTVVNIWKQPKGPSKDEWIKKAWCIHTTDYSAIKKKKNEITPFIAA